MQFGDLDGALRSKHKHFANRSCSTSPAASLLPALPHLCTAVALVQCPVSVVMMFPWDSVGSSKLCLSASSCNDKLMPLSGEMFNEVRDLENRYLLQCQECFPDPGSYSVLIYLSNFGEST